MVSEKNKKVQVSITFNGRAFCQSNNILLHEVKLAEKQVLSIHSLLLLNKSEIRSNFSKKFNHCVLAYL